MRVMKLRLIAALIIAFGILLLASCGNDASAGGTPPMIQVDTLKIVKHPVTNTQASRVTIQDKSKAQQLYRAIYALPKIAEGRICTMQAGPRYELTFLKGEQMVLSANADRSGCGTVSLSKDDQRQPDENFWELLQKLE